MLFVVGERLLLLCAEKSHWGVDRAEIVVRLDRRTGTIKTTCVAGKTKQTERVGGNTANKTSPDVRERLVSRPFGYSEVLF